MTSRITIIHNYAVQYGASIVAIVDANLAIEPDSFLGAIQGTLVQEPAYARAIDALNDGWEVGIDLSNAVFDSVAWNPELYWRIPPGNGHYEQDLNANTGWLYVRTRDTPNLRSGYSPTWIVHTPGCNNEGYVLYRSRWKTCFQSYDLDVSISHDMVGTYLSGGALQQKFVATHDSDGILANRPVVSYGADTFLDQGAIKTYLAKSRLEATPIKTHSIDGIIERGRTKTYSCNALAEGAAVWSYRAGSTVQDIDVTTYRMSGLLVSDEFTPFEIPQAFNIRKPSTSECGGYPFDSRNM